MSDTPELTNLQKMYQARLGGQIEQINAQLEVTAENDSATMTEYVFVNVFLPIFAGTPNPHYNADINTWTNYAGGPYRTVRIIDGSGVVLFTVPPIYDRENINPKRSNLPSIAHVVASTNQYSQIHPMQGEQYLNHELSKRAILMDVPPNVGKNLEIWNAIFKRYGYPLLTEVAGKTDASDGGSELSGEFEDF